MSVVVIHARTHSTVLFHAACTHELSIVQMCMRYSATRLQCIKVEAPSIHTTNSPNCCIFLSFYVCYGRMIVIILPLCRKTWPDYIQLQRTWMSIAFLFSSYSCQNWWTQMARETGLGSPL